MYVFLVFFCILRTKKYGMDKNRRTIFKSLNEMQVGQTRTFTFQDHSRYKAFRNALARFDKHTKFAYRRIATNEYRIIKL